MGVDKYGHVDDAIERYQAKKQKEFYESIIEGRPWAYKILAEIEKE